MRINRDFFDNPIIPDYVLCKANKERIGVLQCVEKTIDLEFNDVDEISFTTYLYINNERNPYYDEVDVMKYILLPDVGFYSITSVNIKYEGTEFENKVVTAKSYECLLAQKYLEEFVINMGTVESLDSVQFYNLRDKSHSLLHLVLEKCPDWEIGHIDPSILTIQRSFDISRQDIYSFLNTDVAEAFGCFFIFDTLNNTINVYKENNIGRDTNIHVSYVNLLKNTNMACTTDNIKTCLTITGSDDLTVREINMGYDKIYNFDYYNSTEFMSKKLYDAYNKWIVLRNSKLPTYTSLLSQYQDYYKQINYLTYEKMPSVADSIDWTEYGLQPLKEQLAAYEQKQAVSMKAGHGDPSSRFYHSEYLPIYNTIQTITAQINAVENQIEALHTQQSSIADQMTEIIAVVDMKSNFTEAELKELSTYIREEELNSSNYIVTDTMADDEKFKMLNDLLKFGENELAKVSVPQLSFSADMVNLFAIPEFVPFYDDFEPGNSIWVTLRDDFSVKARLLSIHINFYDVTDFSVTFGNVVRKKDRCFDITEAIREAASAATSVSFNASYWSQSAKDTSTIGKILDEGLIAAGKYLKNGDDSEMVIDTRGIFVNTTSGEHAYEDSIFIGGGRILFTDDGWKTVSMSVGRADVTINGITESRFGTFADFVVAGYVGGSTLEGDEIIGGTITGSRFNNGNGTFSVDENGILSAAKGRIGCDKNGNGGFIIDSNKLYSNKDSLASNKSGVYLGTDGISLGENSTFKVDNLGNLNAASAAITGRITANEGYIGGVNGFTIQAQKMYSGKASIGDNNTGIYLGTDGIALGANSVFKVTNNGVITAASGHIGGANIINNAIRSDNGNWSVNSDGTATFKNVVITGNSSSLNIGGGFGMTGTALQNFNDLVANKVTANYIDATVQLSANYATIRTLDAVSARVGSLEADHVSVGSFNAVAGRVGSLEADHVTVGSFNALSGTVDTITATYITAKEVKADYMEVKNWVHAGYIRADKINAESIVAKIGEYTGLISVPRLFVTEAMDAHIIRASTLQLGIASGTQITTSCHWVTITIEDSSYTVLCK